MTDDDASFGRRLGRVETDLARQGERLDGMDRRLGGMERTTEDIGRGVHELLRRDAARPKPTNWWTAVGTVGAMLGIIAMLAGFAWWFTAVSPAVQSLDKRLTKIDDPDVGRMLRAEQRLEAVEKGWRATVTVAKER